MAGEWRLVTSGEHHTVKIWVKCATLLLLFDGSPVTFGLFSSLSARCLHINSIETMRQHASRISYRSRSSSFFPAFRQQQIRDIFSNNFLRFQNLHYISLAPSIIRWISDSTSFSASLLPNKTENHRLQGIFPHQMSIWNVAQLQMQRCEYKSYRLR